MKQTSLENQSKRMLDSIGERYIGKSDPYIVMVSTPNNPGGLFERIEKEFEDTLLIQTCKIRLQLWA